MHIDWIDWLIDYYRNKYDPEALIVEDDWLIWFDWLIITGSKCDPDEALIVEDIANNLYDQEHFSLQVEKEFNVEIYLIVFKVVNFWMR